jgi:hypothetical protein
MGKKDRTADDDASGPSSMKWRPEEFGDAGRGALARARAKELRKEAERRAAKKQERMQAKKSGGGEPAGGKSTAESEDDDDGKQHRNDRPARPGGLASSGPAEPPSKPKKNSICRFFLEGKCNRGAGCAFLHLDPASIRSAGAPYGEDGEQSLAVAARPEGDALEALDVFPDLIWAHIMSQMEAAADVARCGATCTALHEVAATDGVWLALQARLFGPHHPVTEEMSSFDARGLCEESDSRLGQWRKAARGTPVKLTLPGVVALSLGRGTGVSVHEDRFVRLWAGQTGRRLGAGALRHRPTCVGVSKNGGAAVVCDARGGVSLYSLEDGVERPAAFLAPVDAQPILSCAWVYGERADGAADASGGSVAEWAGDEEEGREEHGESDAGRGEGAEEEGGEEEEGKGGLGSLCRGVDAPILPAPPHHRDVRRFPIMRWTIAHAHSTQLSLTTAIHTQRGTADARGILPPFDALLWPAFTLPQHFRQAGADADCHGGAAPLMARDGESGMAVKHRGTARRVQVRRLVFFFRNSECACQTVDASTPFACKKQKGW